MVVSKIYKRRSFFIFFALVKYVEWLRCQALQPDGLEFGSLLFHLLVYLDSLRFSSIIYRIGMVMPTSQNG